MFVCACIAVPGMAVLPGGHFLATACPDEIRGWVFQLRSFSEPGMSKAFFFF